jgi:membrane associated rhomboid family serine protease
MMTMTIFFIAITCITSFLAFNNRDIFSKLQFNPYQVYHRKEYYRLITHGFIHADWMHLIVNMFVLYSFGRAVEDYFQIYEVHYANFWYTFMYLSAIIISSLTTLRKYRDNALYNSVGASGAVSAVLFCSIFFNPYNKILLYFIPVPGLIFGILYLIYTQYMSKRNADNINHDAHFIGSVYGFIFPIIIKFTFFHIFINQLLNRGL